MKHFPLKYFLLITATCNYTVACSQVLHSVEVTMDDVRFLGKSDSGFWTLENRELGKKIITHFDFDLKKKWEVDGIGIDREFAPFNFFLFGSKVIAMRDLFNGTSQQEEYTLARVISADGKLDKPMTPVYAIKTWGENKKLRSESYTFDHWISSTGRHVLFTYGNDFKEDYKEGFTYRILDENLGITEPKTLELSYTDPMCNIDEMIYDDSNGHKVFLLVKVYDVPETRKRKIIKTEVVEYDLISNQTKVLEVPVRSPYSFCKMLLRDNMLYLAFQITTSDTKKNNEITDGISITKTPIGFQSMVTDELTYGQSFALYDSSEKEIDFSMLDLTWFGILDNGNIITIAEQNNFHRTTSAKILRMLSLTAAPVGPVAGIGEIFTNRPVYTSKNIVLSYFNIADSGKKTFVIPKYQKEYDAKLVSHLLFPGKNNVRILFTNEAKKESDGKKGINFFAIDGNEKTEVKDCFPNDGNYKIRTDSFIKLDDSTFLISALQKGDTYILKIRINN